MKNEVKKENKIPTKPVLSSKKSKTFDFDKSKFYTIEEAVNLAKQTGNSKFLSSIDIAIKLNLDTTKSDQQLRGTISLPWFFGKEKRILVLDKGLTQKDAKTLGVSHAGDSELISEINKGWLDFDLIITTPKMMPELSKLGKILGTRGMMPNPKNGNVTTDLTKTIAEFKKGISQYRTDSYGNIHMVVGKADADTNKIVENIEHLLSFIVSKKPTAVKGIFIEKVSLSSTMGPGIKILLNKSMSTKKVITKNKNKDVKSQDEKLNKDEVKNVYLKERVKYIQKTKPSKHPENPPVIVNKSAKKTKKVVKKSKPVKKTETPTKKIENPLKIKNAKNKKVAIKKLIASKKAVSKKTVGKKSVKK